MIDDIGGHVLERPPVDGEHAIALPDAGGRGAGDIQRQIDGPASCLFLQQEARPTRHAHALRIVGRTLQNQHPMGKIDGDPKAGKQVQP